MQQTSGNYFVNQRNRDLNKRDFTFKSQRINNSPYVVVQGKSEMQVVKEGEPADLGFKHIGALQMNKTLARPAFVTMAEPVND